MTAKVDIVVLKTVNSAKIIKWKVNEGSMIFIGRVILIYELDLAEDKKKQIEMKSTYAGRIKKLLAKEEEIIQPGEPLLELEECLHPTVMNAMCVERGTNNTRIKNIQTNASISMVHTVPELKEVTEILAKQDKTRLIELRKLVLLVDLDQTLIHTTYDAVSPTLKDVYHFQLHPKGPWHHTRLRPNTLDFLYQMNEFYELHICTFGVRDYAHTIANILDKDGKLFSDRILSRDDFFDPNNKTSYLRSLFPCGDDMVCIIDDKEDVWNYVPNLIHVKPYHFFKHTGDINAQSGLTKQENDDKLGIEFKNLDTNQETNLSEQEIKDNSNINNPETPKDGDLDIFNEDDDDDYLLYLGDILKTVHSAYYELYDKNQAIAYPQQQMDLKYVVPYVHSKVLSGFSLVFSGLVPTLTPLKASRPFRIASALGASVTQDITSATTHLVAARPGTVKFINAQRHAKIKIVSPQWLWVCAERWDHVDEQLFSLIEDSIIERYSPSNRSPEHLPRAAANAETAESYYQTQHDSRKRTSSGRFVETLNPLLSISSKESEEDEICNDSKEDNDEVDDESTETRLNEDLDESTMSLKFLTGDPEPRGWEGHHQHSRKRFCIW